MIATDVEGVAGVIDRYLSVAGGAQRAVHDGTGEDVTTIFEVSDSQQSAERVASARRWRGILL